MIFQGTNHADVKLLCNRENMTLLVEALESGDYKQIRAKLRDSASCGGPRYCCLGVACDLASKAGIGNWGNPETLSNPAAPEYGKQEADMFYSVPGGSGNGGNLTPEVMAWLGLDLETNSANLWLSDPEPTPRSLTGASMNDAGASFAEIAARIREVYLTD